jgi:hypothetical protein
MVTGVAHPGLARPRLVRLARNAALFAWFLYWDTWFAADLTNGKLGADATIYTGAARAWLAGGDPYAVAVTGVPFGAAPPALLAYVPFVPFPDQVVAPLLIVAALAAGIWSLRKVGLPIWWLAFPPLLTGIMLGNAQPLVLALLLLDRPAPTALAGVVKLYALVPPLILGRWRQVAAAAVALLVTAPLLPWGQFIAAGGYADRFAPLTLNASALGLGIGPALITAGALVVLGRRVAAWLAVPGLWPSTQHYYGVFALPVLTPWMAAVMAPRFPGVTPLVIVVAAIVVVLARRRPSLAALVPGAAVPPPAPDPA